MISTQPHSLSWDVIARFGGRPDYELPREFFDDFVTVGMSMSSSSTLHTSDFAVVRRSQKMNAATSSSSRQGSERLGHTTGHFRPMMVCGKAPLTLPTGVTQDGIMDILPCTLCLLGPAHSRLGPAHSRLPVQCGAWHSHACTHWDPEIFISSMLTVSQPSRPPGGRVLCP